MNALQARNKTDKTNKLPKFLLKLIKEQIDLGNYELHIKGHINKLQKTSLEYLGYKVELAITGGYIKHYQTIISW